MKAPAFAYARPASLAEALELLARPGAKLLAGGQSLIPSLNMRLSSPELLVDIGLSRDFWNSVGKLLGSACDPRPIAKPRIQATSPAAQPCPQSRMRRSAPRTLGVASRSRPAAGYPHARWPRIYFVKAKTTNVVRLSNSFKACSRRDLGPDEILARRIPGRPGAAFLELTAATATRHRRNGGFFFFFFFFSGSGANPGV